MSIVENMNYDTSLGSCNGPTTLEKGGNMAAESSPASDNYESESNNYC